MNEREPPAPQQERDVVHVGLTLVIATATIAVIVGSVFWSRGLLRGASPTREGIGAVARPADATTVAGVRIDSIDGEAGAAGRAAQERELDSYGWVDRTAGVVHIPIRRAMELLAGGHPPSPGPALQERP
jgi:hypothetical protein